MGLKAKNGKVEHAEKDDSVEAGYGWGDRQAVEFPEAEDKDAVIERSDSADDLIMVMMPVQTWEAFQDLAKKHGGSPAQAMSTALKLLERACEEVDGGGE